MDSKSIPIKWRQRKKDDSPFDTTVLDVDRTHLALAFMGKSEPWPSCVYRRPHGMGRKPDRWKRYFENSKPAPQRTSYDVLSLIFNAGHRWSAKPLDKRGYQVYKDDEYAR